MSTDKGSCRDRLRDDPKAAAIIDEYERAASGDGKLEACFRLDEHLILAERNEQAMPALGIGRDYAKNEVQKAGFLKRQAEILFRESRFEEAAQLLEQAIVDLGMQPEPMVLFRVYRMRTGPGA